jgi:hypothetical protein
MLNKKEAERRGRALLKQMKGRGWQLRVWENLGWHYSVYNEGVDVHPVHPVQEKTTATRYYALPRPSYSFWCLEGNRGVVRDPNKAVKMAVAECRRVVNDLEARVKTMEEGIQ